MATYRFHYFDTKGRGEASRLLFIVAGKKFDDVRYTKDTWPAFKSKTPFGQMPCLEVNGTLYGQSSAIQSYLAREFGLYGKNSIEAFQIDSILGLVADFGQLMVNAMFIEQDPTKKAALLDKIKTESAPKALSTLEKLISKSGFFVSNSITLADIVVYVMTDSLLPSLGEEVFSKHPKLVQHKKLVESNPKIAAHLKSKK